DLEDPDPAAFDAGLAAAKRAVIETYSTGKVWGDVHRLQVQHVLANIPVLGRRYRFADYPVGGSRETIYKSGHATTTDEHRAFYGSQSRHLSDMASVDENYFLLLGGQDGWINSSTFADQVDLWFERKLIRVPLTEGEVAQAFERRLVLNP
ncbi:MAG: penicillin acylase family protein, partial [Pseudomonadota bacterium]